MGKRQHQKDKMYLTCTEWTTLYGGKKEGPQGWNEDNRLPLGHCCLTLAPAVQPCCDHDGNIFSYEPLLKYLQKYHTNPVTGKPLDIKTLVKLNFKEGRDTKYVCPITSKGLTGHSHVVAVAVTGNVYHYQAVKNLNIKLNSWQDLITNEPFEASDIITIQDPNNIQKFNAANFDHVKKNLRLEDDDLGEVGGESNLKRISKEMREVFDELSKEIESKKSKIEPEKKPTADKFNAAHYSTGAVAAGLTSTTMAPETVHQPAIIAEDLVRYERVKKKGYLRLVTNLGPINLELHCDIVPKTCENFLKLGLQGYYDNTIFHRSIKHFMIQGGDPTGIGTGGKSLWDKPFEDEIRPHLTHSGRGVLSMANSGPSTNKSQFFITYRSCKHLDGKHTVFGRIVGGMDTLSAMEKIEVDNKDKPIEDIVIQSVQVFVDPYQEVDEQLSEEREKEQQVNEEPKVNKVEPAAKLKVFRQGVGKYLNLKSPVQKPEGITTVDSTIKKKKVAGYEFGNFNGW
uniref:Putative cyclophilin type peptidyl-prolyl cis-trans isomerase n=1 Tax=Triatoma dimidiata TaxID=72491 RepID=A0A0V0G9W3_TRIDM